MLDAAYFQEKLPLLQEGMRRRRVDPSLVSKLGQLSSSRKELITEGEKLKAQKNAASQEIGQLMARAKSDPAAAKLADERKSEVRQVGDRVKAIDEKLRETEDELSRIALGIPNIP